MKLSKLKKRKKRSQKKRSKDKSRKAKKTKNILAFFERDFGSEDSSDEELLKSLKRGRKKKIRSHKSEKGHGVNPTTYRGRILCRNNILSAMENWQQKIPELDRNSKTLPPTLLNSMLLFDAVSDTYRNSRKEPGELPSRCSHYHCGDINPKDQRQNRTFPM